MNAHTELEYKFDADNVDTQQFLKALVTAGASFYESHKFDDVFYRRGESVVRHRQNDGNELTVKLRKNDDSIVYRTEINLTLDFENTKVEDVEAFLKATGYEKALTLRKEFAHVFYFFRDNYEVEVSLYCVGKVDGHVISGHHAFLEVEIKSEQLSTDDAREMLRNWKRWVEYNVPGLGAVLNKSLFEMYDKPAPTSTNYRI